MNMHLRLIKILAAGFLRKKFNTSTSTPSVLEMRVWPMDLDFNLHKNNGRYLSCMDLGRFDLAFRLGLHIPLVKERWMPLVGSSTIRYKRSLGAFQRFQLITHIAGWDEKWLFMQQEFRVGDQVYARGVTKVLFRGKDGNIPTKTLMKYAKVDEQSPELPQWILDWHNADQALGALLKLQK
ncbi:MAG: thioesterase family protein [Oceanospirillaceae bacterium]|nr:thioesterase family protein [Oceanospirillaceae bacterium]